MSLPPDVVIGAGSLGVRSLNDEIATQIRPSLKKGSRKSVTPLNTRSPRNQSGFRARACIVMRDPADELPRSLRHPAQHQPVEPGGKSRGILRQFAVEDLRL